MKTRHKIGAAGLAVVLFSFSVPAYAADISIECFNSPTNVMDSDSAGFSVRIYTTSFVNNDYIIDYQIGDILESREVKANAYLEKTERISFGELSNGVYDLSVSVREKNGEEAAKLETKVGIIDYYESRPMEEYSKTSMTTHMSFNAQTDEYEVGLMPKIGLLKNRDEIFWSMVEPAAGKWTFERSDEYMSLLGGNGLETMVVMDYSNQNHVITDKNGNPADDKTAPRTADEMDAFSEYVKRTLMQYPQIKAIEVWNEPNWGFWGPEPDAIDYAAMVKAVSAAAREVRPDIYVTAGSLVYVGHEEFLEDIIDEGILDYADCISSHPYSFPYGSDNVLDGKLKSVNNIISEHGGFKEHMVSEIGLPTSNGDRGADEAKQASEMIKIFAYNEDNGISLTNWYNFRNKGGNLAEEEDNYGILNRDYTPKQALIALSNYNNLMTGSIYFGSAELDNNTNLYIYLKGDDIYAVSWNKASDEVSADTICSGTLDIFGNETQRIIGNTPVYLLGLDENFLYRSLNEELLVYYEKLKASESGFAEKWIGELNKIGSDIESERVKEILEEHILKGLELIEDDYKKSPDTVMTELDALSKIIEKWSGLYAYLSGAIMEFDKNIYIDDKSKMPDTASVLEYAQRNAERLDTALINGDYEGKDKDAAYYSALSSMYYSWADALYKNEEKKKYTNVFLYPEKTDYEIYRGESKIIKVTAVNEESDDIAVTLSAVGESGNRIGESAETVVPAGEKREIFLDLSIPAYEDAGNMKYSIIAKTGGSEISKRSVRVNVKADTTEYNCFDALKFENPQELETVDQTGAVSYIIDGTGINSPHSGRGAVYVSGSGPIRISALPETSDSMPKDGDFIDGEYYLKVMEQVPTDWKQPVIRLYGIRGGEKTLLAEPKDLNSYSVWETKRFEWNRLALESTGIPYDSSMELVCEITVGIGVNGGLKFMLDDISYFTSLNENDDGLQSVMGLPEIEKYLAFNGGFEMSANADFPDNWGQYVPGQDTDMGIDAFEPSWETVLEGKTSIKVNRGGSMWNIVNNLDGISGNITGGSYMLYVPDGAELDYNYPRVWVEYVLDGVTYTAAKSPSNNSQYPVKPGWNKIPILPLGLTVPERAERVNLMVEAVNIIDNVSNRPYKAKYYIDDIQIGNIKSEVWFSENSCSYINDSGELLVSAVLTNAVTNDRIYGNIIAAVYDGGRMVSCTAEPVSMRGRGADGMSSAAFDIDCGRVDGGDLSVRLFFLSQDMLTPVCKSFSMEI